MMCDEIVFATSNDEAELETLFTEYGMGLAGDIEEHILIKKDNEILAGALVTPVTGGFHLAVFAVKAGGRSQGLGSRLLQAIVSQPGRYCRGYSGANAGRYRVTTAAKGSAAGFYRKNGFAVCQFSDLAAPFDEQCDYCPDRETCDPVPMVIHVG